MLKGEYDYTKDREKGEFSENILKGIISETVSGIKYIFGKNNSDFDIVIVYRNDEKTTIEVKTDNMMRSTGNLAVEIYSREKNSGLRVTKALYWAFAVVLKDEPNPIIDFWIIPTKILKETVKMKGVGISTSFGGDKGKDGKGTSFMYLVPAYLIEKDAVYVNGRKFLNFKRER